MNLLDRIAGPEDLKALDPTQLAALAQECRERIIAVITRRGGHLASNLGIVELTLALHRRFKSPKDKLVWDTSNQCYTHKLVTGRQDRFDSVRAPGGLSGFAEPMESPHDSLVAGHAGTGMSYALGMALALQDQPDAPYVVAVVGDGAMTSGMAYEALGNIVQLRAKRLITVFNDNGWSISENVGWLPAWRQRAERGEGGALWRELGFRYIGPVPGHELPALEAALDLARAAADGTPVLVHVLTEKGRGYAPAEENPVRFHQPTTPAAATGGGPRPTYTQVFAATLTRLMERDPKIVAITAAMLEGTGLGEVRKRFPTRVFDVGIAEEHAVTMAAGLAKAGFRPVVSLYSTFLQRSFDQILHDVCIQGLPVTLCVDRAGLVGDDGKTHQGVFDVAFTRIPPGIAVAAPKDENELQHMLFTAIYSGRPFALRYPRGLGMGVAMDAEPRELEIGRAELLRGGSDLLLLPYGSMVGPALEAAERLAASGVSTAVINARFAKPVSAQALRRLAPAASRWLTVEEHTLTGGFGAAVLEAAAAEDVPATVRCHGIRDRFIEHAPQAQQRHLHGLDADGIVAAARAAFPDLAAAPAGPKASPVPEPEAVAWA